MQKIIIKNFGPVKKAEIEITPLLVLIGEQATGKSTIAKLIYFFKSLSDALLNRYLESTDFDIDLPRDVISVTREKFFDFFGSTLNLDEFIVTYYYCEDGSLTLTLTENKKLAIQLSEYFQNKDFSSKLSSFKESFLILKKGIELSEATSKTKLTNLFEHTQINFLRQFTTTINEIFSNVHNDSSYIIAGRNATIGYSSFFESMLAASLQKRLESQASNAYEAKEQTIEESLMLDFLQRVSNMRQFMNKYGDFEGIIQNAHEDKRKVLTIAHSLVQKIIRGNYTSGADEKIMLDDGNYVYLTNASSGQKEAIRILQDAFIAINSDNNVSRIIEEPEAHIFPEAQMYLLQLLAMLLNNKENNQIIITTHSPYVLSVINNLMYAYKVGQKDSEKVNKIVQKESWLDPEKVNAYMLTSAKGSERIIDDDLDMIKAERIDEVSEKLNEDFNKLLNIEYGEESKE